MNQSVQIFIYQLINENPDMSRFSISLWEKKNRTCPDFYLLIEYLKSTPVHIWDFWYKILIPDLSEFEFRARPDWFFFNWIFEIRTCPDFNFGLQILSSLMTLLGSDWDSYIIVAQDSPQWFYWLSSVKVCNKLSLFCCIIWGWTLIWFLWKRKNLERIGVPKR